MLMLPVTQVPVGLNRDGLPLGIQVKFAFNYLVRVLKISTFKYHVSCADGEISELFIFITYSSTAVPFNSCVFFPVGLSSSRMLRMSR